MIAHCGSQSGCPAHVRIVLARVLVVQGGYAAVVVLRESQYLNPDRVRQLARDTLGCDGLWHLIVDETESVALRRELGLALNGHPCRGFSLETLEIATRIVDAMTEMIRPRRL